MFRESLKRERRIWPYLTLMLLLILLVLLLPSSVLHRIKQTAFASLNNAPWLPIIFLVLTSYSSLPLLLLSHLYYTRSTLSDLWEKAIYFRSSSPLPDLELVHPTDRKSKHDVLLPLRESIVVRDTRQKEQAAFVFDAVFGVIERDTIEQWNRNNRKNTGTGILGRKDFCPVRKLPAAS